jgi:IS1 family transposase/transposase-like protein
MDKKYIFCPNQKCKYFKMRERGNIEVKQTQGKCQRIDLMRCTECGVLFSERKGTVYFGIHYPDDFFDEVMMLLMTRASIKDIEMITGVSEHTIQRWEKKAAGYLQQIHEKLVRDLKITECQVDELWTFVLMKRKTIQRKGREAEGDIGDQWIFMALDPVSKLLIHWKIGKRTLETAKDFIGELKGKLASSPLFTTDEWPAYEEAFLSNFSEEVHTEPRKRRGRPRKKPIIKPDKELKLAQTHKYREKGRVVKVSEEIIFGDEKEIEAIIKNSPVSNRINTSIIERSNGTFRAKVSRVVRQSYSFSKNKEMHEAHITIYAVYYNLIWKHSRLKKTAAWLSGLVDRGYTFRELFQLRNPEFIWEH